MRTNKITLAVVRKTRIDYCQYFAGHAANIRCNSLTTFVGKI